MAQLIQVVYARMNVLDKKSSNNVSAELSKEFERLNKAFDASLKLQKAAEKVKQLQA